MIFEPKQITLKNGETALFRSPVAADSLPMLDYLVTCASETHFILRTPEECQMTEEQEAAFFERVNASNTDVMIVCLVRGEIAGNCHLSFLPRVKTKHRAGVAIALKQKFWNLGIGTMMFEEMIVLCRKHGTMQMELSYIEGNTRARTLYEKMGFCQVAEHPNAICLEDGQLLKEMFMVKSLA